VASALPLIFRAKQVVVIGDPKQLRHISKVKDEEEKLLKEHLKLQSVWTQYVAVSLWDRCRDWLTHARGYNKPVMLNGHYRCHPEIIGYSNRFFYSDMGGLVVRTGKFMCPIREQGCYWEDVKGSQVSPQINVNVKEVNTVVGKAVELQTVGVDDFGGTAYCSKSKAALPLFDEVLHLAALAVVRDDLACVQFFHRCDDEHMLVDHLPVGLLDLVDHSAGMLPAASLVHELAVDDLIADMISFILGSGVQFVIHIGRKCSQRGVLLEADRILAGVGLKSIADFRCGETAVATHVKIGGRIVFMEFDQQVIHELTGTIAAILGTVAEFCLKQISGETIVT
jgi:hypothetical protein